MSMQSSRESGGIVVGREPAGSKPHDEGHLERNSPDFSTKGYKQYLGYSYKTLEFRLKLMYFYRITKTCSEISMRDDQALYAHSAPDQDFSAWEPLRDHLTAVANRAAEFGAVFRSAQAARAMGALHDAGKTAAPYQAYIRGNGPSPDHSTAGAVLACRTYGALPGKLLAFGIAGHHGGLANGSRAGGEGTPLKERLRKGAAPSLPPDLDVAPAADAVLAEVEAHRNDAFAAAFYARMLFSCLVDADFLETERYYAELKEEAPDRGCPLDIKTLRERLTAHLATMAAGLEPPLSAVNALRARVLETVLSRAAWAPGLFSLTVPTGGGKTLASLAFALNHALSHPQTLRRVIYVIPFTSIVEQTAGVFRAALGSDDAVLEHHSAYDPGAEKTGSVRDDEGPDGGRKLRLAAENWDRPVVVTTAVQFFESLFANRRSRCRKLHNIAGSVIVLDEAQTLPLKFLRPCLEALRELARNYGCSVVLCTATQPAVRTEDGFKKGGLDGVRELAPEPEALYRSLKRATVTRCPEPLDLETLAGRLAAEPQVLCIVNNRRHARDLHHALGAQAGARLLTTALCAAHRRRVLADIRATLLAGRPVRLVATSLIEAGVDVSFPAVWRAAAGLDSLAQAAGRCNRHGELGPEGGRVFLFDPLETEDHKPPPELEQFAAVARDALRKHGDDPLSLEAVRFYFKRLYWQRSGGDWEHGTCDLDGARVGERKGILAAVLESGRELDFPFADIADAFHLIDDTQVPVIVPYDTDDDDLKKQLKALEHVRLPGGIARKLQPYLVQIPRQARKALLAAGSAHAIRDREFGQQFVVLDNHDLYHPITGLNWDDPYLRDVRSGMY